MRSLVLYMLFFSSLLIAQVPGNELQLQLKFIRTIGERGDAPGQFESPASLDVSPMGRLYVVDTGNNRIQQFDELGKLVSHIGGFGWESGQFQQPMDIDSGNALDLYIADQENNRIERYDKDLNWISSLYSDDALEENLRFAFPVSLSINMHGELFIIDRDYKRTLKFNSQFEPIIRFGDFDWGDGALKTPVHIHVSQNDKVYISDQEAGCVKVYDDYGNYLYDMGNEQLSSPTGLCTGPKNLLIVADSVQDQLLFFDVNGRLVYTFGASGDAFGAFNKPGDVSCFRDNLYVADTGNHRIQLFKLTFLSSN